MKRPGNKRDPENEFMRLSYTILIEEGMYKVYYNINAIHVESLNQMVIRDYK